MNLSEQQIEFISNSLTINGINSEALKEDIVDYICTAIEVETPQNFESIYSRIIEQFGGYYNMKEIQKETTYAAYSKKNAKSSKSNVCICLRHSRNFNYWDTF